MFLTPEELAQLTGYRPCQRARTCRWLDENGIAHTVNRLGDPVVLRSAIESDKNSEPEFKINIDWLKSA
jgi:methylphosphotriester-DNA--protein-cysteine methyltransferase